MSPKGARAQRIDAACDFIENTFSRLAPDEAEQALLDFCPGYIMAQANGLRATKPKLHPITAAAAALEGFIGAVRPRIAAMVKAEMSRLPGGRKQ